MATETLGASFNIDVTALKAGLAQANRLIRESESEFKAAAAGMDDWGKSQEGVEAKIKSLNTITDLQQKKVDALTKEYDSLIADGLDPASAEAVKLRTNINKEQEALNKNLKEIDKQTKSLQEMSGETDETVTASQKLRNEIDKQEKSLSDLSDEYANAVLEQGKSSKSAKELKSQIKKLSGELDENKSKLDKATEGLDKVKESAKNSGDGFTVAKGAISGFISNGLTALAGAAKNAISSIMNLADETREFRQDMATLETAFSEAKFTTEQATDTWKNLYAVFGEDDRAVEASNNIARMAKNQEDLDAWVKITTGVWGTYQDALPVESLAEAAAETAKVGTVTGTFADSLNWSSEAAKMFSKYMSEDVTTAEDAFNVALSECNTEAERQALITETLTTLYGGAADKYNETSASIIEANKATADMTLTQAELGEKIEPITSKIRGGFAQILDKILELVADGSIEDFGKKIDDAFSNFIDNVLPKITNGIQWILDHKELIAGIAVVIGTVATAIGVLNAALAIQNAIMLASPTTWIILGIVAAVAALIAIIVVCVKHWDSIMAAGKKAVEGIKNAWASVSDWFKTKIIEPISNFFTGMWDKLKNGAKNAWQGIKDVFSKVGSFFSETFSNAWQKVKNIFSVGGKIFDGIKDGIVSAFKNIVNGIIKGINKVVSGPFNAINTVLGKVKNVSILGAKPFENMVKTISVPEIPLLARGGVVKKATNAIIGEDGAEAVVPLEHNTEWIDKVADKVASKTQGVVVNQTNNYSQAHSRYEMYKSKQQTAVAVKLALAGG